ncbi:universal stress protein [Halobellus sp. Atlit-38R]|jgi:nucleotide-binding universal stress UspA family protein|uniref:universal stress protein n=1 Tax=Halobellus sp. Atlit-38R TaxID=2282131 RepID=UPI000EF1FD3B|nr:universal stress protein [Halobellus sp. Atlit-38R]RLM88143.1 universal stress protein [Halobellus sp. Atlit-38R]
MFERILLPTDGTESMDAVVETAADIAGRRDAEVYILYVIDDRAFLTLQDDMKTDVLVELEGEGEAATDRAATRLREAGIEVTTAIRQGDPADEILAYADEVDADLITMGTRRGDYTNNLMGSVSQNVVARSAVPVLTTNLAADE